ncbi:hypothetical protein DFQ26_000927 [Actinomortierella ambigua]|nr:hypothetical protein DFQ26_000927 [Actinomortierella ambigua]
MDDTRVSRFGFYLPHGAGLLTLLFDHIDKTPCVDSLWSALLTSILEQTSQPYCDMLSRWLGITPESNDYEPTRDMAAMSTAASKDAPPMFQFGDHIHRHLQGLDSFTEFFVQSKSEWVFEGSHPLLLRDEHRELGEGFGNLTRETSGLQSWDDEFQLNPLCPPAAFVSNELAQKVLEAGKALQMMLEYDTQHPLSISSRIPPLRWVFSQKELKDDRRQREEHRRTIISRMVDRLRTRGFLANHQHQLMDLDLSDHGAPISPDDDGRMHIELPGSLHANLLDYPGAEVQDSSWNPFAHREHLGAFFNYSAQLSEPSVTAREKSRMHTMEELLSSADGQEEDPQQHQQQEYALLPMTVLAQECISYPLQIHAGLIDTCFVSFFFHDLHLLDHWRVVERFMLMRDGIFVTLFSDALFDDENGFIQQQLTKAVGKVGPSRAQERKMNVPWPPRGGELEAGLRTVLLDAFQSIDPKCSLQADVLDDTLAFAVKDYRENVTICRDIHAMESLDFLYLEYRPPGPVQMLILQPQTMEKYTRLFTFHLRLLRVHASMQQCFRQLKTLSRIPLHGQRSYGSALQATDLQFLQQFRFEAEQVLEGLRGYLFDTAVGANWTRFMKRMEATKSRVEAHLLMEEATATGGASSLPCTGHRRREGDGDGGEGDDDDDDEGHDYVNGCIDSLPAIREAHEQVLEQILVQALLKRKQRPVLKVVHEVLGCMVQLGKQVRELLQILEAASNERDGHEGMEEDEGDDDNNNEKDVAVQETMQRVRAQYERFRSACTMLTRVLKALDGSMQGEKRTRFLQQLLVRLGWFPEGH